MTDQPPVRVSVVMATHNRRRLLRRALDCLAAQRLAEPYEVVVVDDGSTDGTWEDLQEATGRTDLRLRALRQETATGPAAARNRGWRAATGEVVAFTDDDCYPTPTWLAELVGAVERHDIAQGLTEPDPERAPGRGPFARTMWVLEPDGFYATCNIAYRRRVLEEVGGFDEGFHRPFGEDTDLAWRALEAGATSVFVAGAVVHHEVWPSRYADYVRDRARREAIVRATRRHPGLRRYFFSPHWYQGAHPLALAAGVGLAVAASGPLRPRRLVTGAALVAGYVHHRVSVRPLPCRRRNLVPVVALAWAADIVEVGVLAAASARYRTLLL
ncbi:MAG TPA: glycosyltransferase family A protein [Acidimicrobiales bacterium]|nr:glycosyltransferase family A protein [Acidimicrobiales bacterium]